jgi:hypothetical protein
VLCAASGTWSDRTNTVLGSAGPTRTYTTDADFDEGSLNGVNHDAPNSNQLQLSETTTTEKFLYVAHTNDGILLKLNTETGAQVARYHTQRTVECTIAGCTPSPTGWYPSRTAVDLNGDVWVANRAFGAQGTITKIANNPGDCIDRNGNGVIDTSSDVDADGAVELTPPEFFGQTDECVIKSIPVAGIDHLLRALAIDSDGDLWVGTFQHGPAAYEIDGVSGALKRVIPLSSSAYGFVVRGNFLYHASLAQAVERIDISPGANLSGPPGRVVLGAGNNYGIAVDDTGIAWFGDYGSGLQRCSFNAPAGCSFHGGDPHYGLGVDGDGDVWAASPSSNRVQKYSPTGVLLGHAITGGNIQPYGVAIGHDGHPWTAGWAGVAKLDKGAVHGAPGPGVALYSTAYIPGQPAGVNSPFNYTYSDFTGFQARNVTVKQGTWTVVHDGGTAATPWGKVTWNQEAQGSTPSGTLIKAEVRSAENTGDLAALPYVEVTNGGGFAGQVGRYLEVRMTLRIVDLDAVSPILSDVTIEPSNQSPTAICQDVTVGTGPAACTATASINNGSSDPDGDPLNLSQLPSVFGLGTTSATLTVSDPLGMSASCSANVTVVDDAPPSITCPAPTTIECAGPTTMFSPAAATAADNCSVTVNNAGGGSFPLGTTTLSYSATDGAGASASCTSAVTVVDTTAPVISSVTNSFATVWPPNHSMVALSLSVTATDSCTGGTINTSAGACRITNITSNEAINSTGDGDTDPDWVIGGGLNGSIRAERKGNGSGRIYTVTVVCADANGNDSAPATTTIAVPHSGGKF